MAWSRLKSRWRELLAPSIAGRVDVHMAGYRNAYERRGRAWLTVDGEEVASFCEFEHENAWREESRRETPPGRFTSVAWEKIHAAGHRHKRELLDSLGICIGSPIDQLLASDEFLVRALAMLDRRLGKRRLAQLDPKAEHPLVARLFNLRCASEGMRDRSAV